MCWPQLSRRTNHKSLPLLSQCLADLASVIVTIVCSEVSCLPSYLKVPVNFLCKLRTGSIESITLHVFTVSAVRVDRNMEEDSVPKRWWYSIQIMQLACHVLTSAHSHFRWTHRIHCTVIQRPWSCRSSGSLSLELHGSSHLVKVTLFPPSSIKTPPSTSTTLELGLSAQSPGA